MMRSKAKFLESLSSLATEFNDYDFGQAKNAQQNAREHNLVPAINDAFFGSPSHGTGPDAFVARINRPDSNFNKAAQSVEGKITISIYVDAKSQVATFKVMSAKPDLIKKALEADYVAMYGQTPSQRFQKELAAKTIRPADISGTALVTTL